VVAENVAGGNFYMQLVRPIEYTAQFTMFLDDYLPDSFAYTNTGTVQLTINSQTAILNTFTLQNPELISESVNFNREGVPQVTLEYKGIG
jgi:hypothetical protein